MAKKSRKKTEPPAQEELTVVQAEPVKKDEENAEKSEEGVVVPSDELQSFLDKSNAELREICRAKGIKKFGGLKHADLARAAFEGKNNPEMGQQMRNDQLRMRLRDLGLKGVSASRADLLARVSEAESWINRTKAAINFLSPGAGDDIDPASFRGEPKNLLDLVLKTIEAKSEQ